MPLVHVTRTVEFNAAHRLHNPAKSDDWNRETYGKCNFPNWHGHNYTLEVTVVGEPSPETGYVMDLGVLKALLETHIVSKVDHRNLNLDVDFLQGLLPSTENVVVAFWQQLEPHLPDGIRLSRMRLAETARNAAEYYGE